MKYFSMSEEAKIPDERSEVPSDNLSDILKPRAADQASPPSRPKVGLLAKDVETARANLNHFKRMRQLMSERSISSLPAAENTMSEVKALQEIRTDLLNDLAAIRSSISKDLQSLRAERARLRKANQK